MDLILSHDHTDFDAVASQLGAALLVPEFVPVLARSVNRNVRDFLTLYRDRLPFQRLEELPPDVGFERLLLVDTQTPPSLKGLEVEALVEVRVVDHHPPRDGLPETWQCEYHQTGACATVFVERLAEQHQSLSPIEATLLLLGIYEDTGSLSYGGTTPADMRAAAWLVEHGANLDVARDFLRHPLTPEQRDLYRRLLDGIQFHPVRGYEIVIAMAQVDDYVEEVSTLAHMLRDLYDPDALFLLIEMAGHIQMVARSATDAVPVGEIMAAFEGGGHERAAAAFVDDATLEAVRVQLLDHLKAEVRPAVTVGALMSRGTIRTLGPREKIEQAAALMKRWGHEGFPVVDEGGQVVGMLTRRDVDRAMQHELARAPVADFMHKGEIFVRPDAGVEQLRAVMTSFNVGQVPVVEGDPPEVIGIVTRTDLLKLWGKVDEEAAGEGTGREALLARLRAAVAPELLRLVNLIADEANALGASLFFVGGFVRDLLLEQPVKDLDLVVEGDAIAVADRLVARYGGRVVAHRRFGTAKWFLAESSVPDAGPALPAHIDLVTARTEFYERPTALPQVERSSIKQDLHRRDFTINTLAIALDEDRFGQLLDFYGGEADLRAGLIRVLHNLSFVEDPTRILRAVRFAARLDFAIETRTQELLVNSLELIERVSGDRIRHELDALFHEAEPVKALRALTERGVAAAIDPVLALAEGDEGRLQQLWAAHPEALPLWSLAALTYDADAESRLRVGDRLLLPVSGRRLLTEIGELCAARADLTDPELAPSALDRLFRRWSQEAIELVAVLDPDERLRDLARRYLSELHPLTLTVTGHDLRQLGLPQGPRYAEILDQIRAEVLDGLLPDAEAQRRRLAELATPPMPPT